MTARRKELNAEIDALIQAAAVLVGDHLKLKARAAAQGIKSVPADQRIADLMARAVEKEFELAELEGGEK